MLNGFNSIMLAITLGAVLAIVQGVGKLNANDQAICELSHSHDVCFQVLNR